MIGRAASTTGNSLVALVFMSHGAWTTSNSVVNGCDAAEPDEREDVNGPHEPGMVPHKGEMITASPAPCTHEFEDSLLEPSIQHFAATACDADLQVN